METAEPLADFGAAHPLRPVLRAGSISLALFALCAAIIYLIYRPVTPPAIMTPLTAIVTLYVLLWAGVVVAMTLRRPGPEELVRLWGKVTIAIILTCHAIALWLTWAVLPYGEPAMQFMAIAILLTNSPSQIILSPESVWANRFGVVVVNGSTVAFLLTRGSLLAAGLALYVAGFAIMMFVVSKTIARTVQETVDSRLASEQAARALEEALAVVAAERDAKTRFISAASHDLGQPLQAAALFFDQSQRAKDDAARHRAADGVRGALAAADQLLSHMLNHLRLEADAVKPHPSRIAARQALSKIAAQLAPAAEAAGVEVRVAGRGSLTLLLDPALFDRAIGNLAHNALQHSRGRRLLLAARRHGRDAVRVWAIDDGVGIGLIEAKHIFEDYYQGAPAIAASRAGFGLGLSSVRRIAELSGGLAGLDRRWVRGAAFYMEFPDVTGERP